MTVPKVFQTSRARQEIQQLVPSGRSQAGEILASEWLINASVCYVPGLPDPEDNELLIFGRKSVDAVNGVSEALAKTPLPAADLVNEGEMSTPKGPSR